MTQITIQCSLVASELTRKLVWELMAEKNTPLINEILWQINNHPNFKEWQSEGKLPSSLVSDLCKSLKEDPLCAGQPSRFYLSVTKLVNYIYKSWLKLQQRRQRKLEGQERWLSMLKSDTELLKECECSLDILRSKAREILTNVEVAIAKSQKKSDAQKIPKKSSLLFALYDETKEDVFTRSAICYLLKNGSKLPQLDKLEDRKEFAQRRRKVAIKIERLKEQLEGSRPHGRDLTSEQWLETLHTAAKTVSKDNKQARVWQDILLSKPKSLPFPITFETNEDLKWHKNETGRLCVRFNGLSKHTFKVYCDCRQLHWFRRFLEDQETKKEGKNSHSSGLFTLRSAKLAWKENPKVKKGEPWNINRLILYCTVDTRLWSFEGTKQVRAERVAKYAKDLLSKKPEITFPFFFRTKQIDKFLAIWQVIASHQLLKLHEKQDFDKAVKNLQQYIVRLESSIKKINKPYPRPSRQLYTGNKNIILAVAMGLEKPATVAILDGSTGRAIAYRSIKQLLGKNYRLLNRQRQQKKTLSHLRHKAQKRSADNQKGESNLGAYLDRLIAKAIVELAKEYQISEIAVPKIEDMREVVQSEIKAKAEAKIPGYEKGQKKYAKQYRINIHNWSYGRLIENITTQASKLGIAIAEVKQPVRGSPTEKAKDIAIALYNKNNRI